MNGTGKPGERMEIQLNWQQEMFLSYDPDSHKYTLAFDDIAASPGIYVFGRRFGGKFEALYVGKATSLRSRLTYQLNNHKLMTHIAYAKSGQRVVIIGHFDAKKGQQSKKCLPIAERALIRHFVAKYHDLVNVHGVKIKHHTILSAGIHKAKDFPANIQIEAA